MKNLLRGLVLLTSLSSYAAYAGFLDDVSGQYKVVKDGNCTFESGIEISGNARIESNETGATLLLEAIICGLTRDIPIRFLNGKGSKKKTEVEGDILPLPVTRKTVWETNESSRTSKITEYEGVLVAKKTGTYTLIETSPDHLSLGLDTVKCHLIRD